MLGFALLIVLDQTIVQAFSLKQSNDLLEGKGLFSTTENFGNSFFASTENIAEKDVYSYSVH